jgi:hypothetical protein
MKGNGLFGGREGLFGGKGKVGGTIYGKPEGGGKFIFPGL